MHKVLLLTLFSLCFSSPLLAEKTKKENKVIDIDILLSTMGNDITFDQKSIQVPLGRKVRLTYKNMAKQKSQIYHNVYILKPGTEEQFIKDMRDSGYDQEKIAKHEAVLGKTKNLLPGKSDTITFMAEKPGYYPYICTMPGHGDVMGMKGIIHVQKGKKKK